MQIFFPNSLETMIHQWISRAQSLSTNNEITCLFTAGGEWWLCDTRPDKHTLYELLHLAAVCVNALLTVDVTTKWCQTYTYRPFWLFQSFLLGEQVTKLMGWYRRYVLDITILSLPKINYLTAVAAGLQCYTCARGGQDCSQVREETCSGSIYQDQFCLKVAADGKDDRLIDTFLHMACGVDESLICFRWCPGPEVLRPHHWRRLLPSLLLGLQRQCQYTIHNLM